MKLHNEARGFRNNNPGNIRHGEKWLGLAEEQTDPNFCQFESVEYGIRAIFKILDTYREKYKIVMIANIIYRWAPPRENNTESYVRSVLQFMNDKKGHDELLKVDKYGANSVVNDENSGRFIQALIRHENGNCPLTVGFIKSCINFGD